MKFIEQIGNIKVYVQCNSNNDITVCFYNGSDCIMSEVYFTDDIGAAIADLFRKIDTYTSDWLFFNVPDIKRISNDTLQSGSDYFCRVDDSRYFKRLTEPTNGWLADKNGKRIIDR